MNNLMWVAGVTFSLSIFICLGSIILNVLKLSEAPRNLSNKRLDNSKSSKSDRRRIKSNPNIVCGFPIYQAARQDPPFS